MPQARDDTLMIDLYTYATPNGHKASIMLEETGLPYAVHVVDIERGDQHAPKFRALNPNGKIAVIVDRATRRTVFESGAILSYLAQKSGRFYPSTPDEQIETLQWLFFQVGHIGPMMGQLWYFKVFAPEKIPLAIERYEREAVRLFGVLNERLRDRDYLRHKSIEPLFRHLPISRQISFVKFSARRVSIAHLRGIETGKLLLCLF